MKDKYLDLINENYGNILRMYKIFEQFKPIIEYDIQKQKIYSYPYEEYRDNLASVKSQEITKEQYDEAMKEGNFVVFVRDSKNKKLRSYILEINEN